MGGPLSSFISDKEHHFKNWASLHNVHIIHDLRIHLDGVPTMADHINSL